MIKNKRLINFANIINKCKNFTLFAMLILKSISFCSKLHMVINIISFTFLDIIVYLFMRYFKLVKLLLVFLFSIITIIMFSSDKFSKNKVIKFLQKLVFFNSVLALIISILNLFDISLINTVYCNNINNENNDNNKELINQNEEKSIKNKDLLSITPSRDEKNEEYYNIKARKFTTDSIVKARGNVTKKLTKEFLPDIGIIAITGKILKKVTRQTISIYPIHILDGTAFVMASRIVVGIDIGK